MAWTSRLYGQDSVFQSIRESFHDLPHIFITGPPGSGKTTFLEDLMELMKKQASFKIESVLWLTSEKDRGIHTIRDKVNDFCKRTHSLPNTLRFIVIDDADTLPLISQQALRRPMETYNHLTRFLFASRHASSLIEPLRSRCLTLELEPISPVDAVPLYMNLYNIQYTKELFDFCLRNFISIHEVKTVLKLYKATQTLDSLKSLLPVSTEFTNALIHDSITSLYLNGYLLDDILLSVEKSISLFPSIDPSVRFRILQFTMLGWISIQQGKEHWLDTMDIVNQVVETT
jgi:energy-coupling factor transporter ATP-binding protein EcfA2